MRTIKKTPKKSLLLEMERAAVFINQQMIKGRTAEEALKQAETSYSFTTMQSLYYMMNTERAQTRLA